MFNGPQGICEATMVFVRDNEVGSEAMDAGSNLSCCA